MKKINYDKFKYPIIRISNLFFLIIFLVLTNIEGAEYVGLYFFYTIYLWLFIILSIIEIKLFVLNKKKCLVMV